MMETSNEFLIRDCSKGVYVGVIWDILGGPDWGLEDIVHTERRANYKLLKLS